MRLTWFARHMPTRRRPAPARLRGGATLRVRRLERRRVLDAAAASVVASPVVEISPQVTSEEQDTLVFDWSAVEYAGSASAGEEQASAAEPQQPTAMAASANTRPVLVVPLSQTVHEGQVLDLSGQGGAPPLGLYVDLDMGDTHTATVNWGDASPIEATAVFAGIGSGALGGTHTYADNGTFTVTVSVTDSQGESDTRSFKVTVNNVAPTATLTNDGPISEGGSAEVFFVGQIDPSTADTAAGFRYAYDLDNDGTFEVGDGTYAGSVTSDSQAIPASFFVEGPSSHVVRGRIIDKDGGFTDYTTQIEVLNVAPDLTNITGATVNEGQVATIGLTIADPGASDVFSVDVDWRDGSSATITGLGASNASGMIGNTSYTWTAATRRLELSHRYLDDGPNPGMGISTHLYAVELVVRDEVDASAVHTADVLVNNVRPVLVVQMNQTVDEGSLLDLSGMAGAPPLGLFVDQGVVDTHTAIVHWGDGSPIEMAAISFASGAGALGGMHTYLDSGVYTVTVTVADDDGGSDTRSFQVTVLNVAPTAVFSNDGPVNEGATATVIFSGQFDPGATDVAAGLRYAYDFDNDGSFDIGDGTYAGSVLVASQVVPATYLADGPAVRTVRGRIIDKDGGFTDYTTDVEVLNVPPVLADIAGDTINEGQVATIGVTIVDPSPLEVFSIDVDWRDGATATITGLGLSDTSGMVGETSYVWTAATRRLELSHQYLDDGPNPGMGNPTYVYDVQLAVHDDDGGTTGPYTANVVVNNVRPVLIVQTNQTVNEGQLIDLSGIGGPPLGLFVDDGILDTHTATIDWGDGSAVESAMVSQFAGSGALGGSHVYADNGVYTVTVTVTDDDGGSATRSFRVTVLNVAPSLTGTAGVQVNEGDFFTLASLGIALSDPGFDNALNPLVAGGSTEEFAGWMIDWGDGTATTPLNVVMRVNGGPGAPTTAMFDHAAHVYADNGLYTVTLRLADDDMAAYDDATRFVSGTAGVDFVDLQFQIVVNNVAPTLAITSVTPGAPTTILENSGVSFSAAFSDPGFDNPLNPLTAGGSVESFTFDIDWGDGRQTVLNMASPYTSGAPGVLTMGDFGGSHVYADDGEYTVTVTIRDDDGGSDVRTFTVIVQNVPPSFVPAPSGASFVGTDINSQGFSTIRVAFSDPGFDNPANPNAPAPPNITDTLHESFTHVLDWGDGTVDAVHTYPTSGTYEVSVTVIGPGGMQMFNLGSVTSGQPVVTLVTSQTLNDPAVVPQAFTYIVDWGDGAVQTIPLMLRQPGDPVLSNGLTTVTVSQRESGDVGVLTTGSFEVRHRYLGPPNPLNPTADIPITVTIVDDNNGSVSDFILVGNPGIRTIDVAIDTTPQVPRLEVTPPAPPPGQLEQTTSPLQGVQSSNDRVASGDTSVASELYFELVVISPDGQEVARYRLKDEALFDLRRLFATLPDGHYKIFQVRTDNQSRRLVIEVYVRGGRVIDPSDDTEGTRDRPPTSEAGEQPSAQPLEDNPLLERVPEDAADSEPLSGRMPAAAGEKHLDREFSICRLQSNRWATALAGLSLAAAGGWSRQVEAALAEADDRAWQRLRRAGRLGRRRSRS